MTARPGDYVTVGREDAVSPDRILQKVPTSESKLAAQSCTQWHHTQAGPFHKPVGMLSSLLQQQNRPRPTITAHCICGDPKQHADRHHTPIEQIGQTT